MFARTVRGGGAPALLLAATVVGCSASGPSGNAPGERTQKPVVGGAGPDASAPGTSFAGGSPSCPGDAGPAASRAITWVDGTSHVSGVIIASGMTVVIAPGAAIGMGATAGITVQGTLIAHSACGPHAQLTWPAGAASTSGIVVTSGGTLVLDGVDVTGANAALTVLGGADAEYDHARIDGATAPFTVAPGGILKTTGAAVINAQGASSISGALVAAYLDYNANGNSGIVADDSASIDIRHSRLHGDGPDADMVISQGSTGATAIHVSNTEIYDVHCAFHFEPVTTFDISYTNIHDNAFAFMLYGSGPAGGTISYSNVGTSNQVAFDPAGTNGTITFDHCYIPGGAPAAPVVISNPAASPVAGTGPM
jgi:hypothetical protein